MYMDLVPGDLFVRWFESDESSAADPSLLALILPKVAEEVRKSGKKPSPKLARVIEESASVPGDLQLAFCFCVEETDPRLPEVLVEVLNRRSSEFSNPFNEDIPFDDEKRHPSVEVTVMKWKGLTQRRQEWFRERVTSKTGREILERVAR